jgi:branched-chain amino acid transport system substrate-binding protein
LTVFAAEKGVTKDEIKIGMFGPVTGAYVFWNDDIYVQGTILAFDDLNKRGGIYGRKIKVIMEDDLFSMTGSVTAVRKLIHQESFIIVGGMLSPGVDAVRPVVAEEKIPLVAPGPAGDSYLLPYNTDPSGPWIFGGFQVTQRVNGNSIVDFAVKRGAKRIAIIYHPNSWGVSALEAAKQRVAEHKLELVSAETLALDATDASVQILKMKEAKADFVFSSLLPRPLTVLVKQAYELGLKAPICSVHGGIMGVETLGKAVGPKALTDFYYTCGAIDGAQGPLLAEWRKNLEKVYPEKVGEGFPRLMTVGGTAGGITVIEALKRTGPDLTREKFRNTLEGLKDFDTGLLANKITFSPTNHIAVRRATIIRYDGIKEERIE